MNPANTGANNHIAAGIGISDISTSGIGGGNSPPSIDNDDFARVTTQYLLCVAISIVTFRPSFISSNQLDPKEKFVNEKISSAPAKEPSNYQSED